MAYKWQKRREKATSKISWVQSYWCIDALFICSVLVEFWQFLKVHRHKWRVAITSVWNWFQYGERSQGEPKIYGWFGGMWCNWISTTHSLVPRLALPTAMYFRWRDEFLRLHLITGSIWSLGGAITDCNSVPGDTNSIPGWHQLAPSVEHA